jgi:hypothetical protein
MLKKRPTKIKFEKKRKRPLSMFYVQSTNYTGFIPEQQDKTSELPDSPHGKKRRKEVEGGNPWGTSESKINTLTHTYPFLLHAIAPHFFPLTVKLPSSVLPSGKTSFP